MNLGAGSKLKRKNKDGTIVEWSKGVAKTRVSLLPKSYLEIEEKAALAFESKAKA
jgi:cytidine deaminase